jgi:hypothetical protein
LVENRATGTTSPFSITFFLNQKLIGAIRVELAATRPFGIAPMRDNPLVSFFATLWISIIEYSEQQDRSRHARYAYIAKKLFAVVGFAQRKVLLESIAAQRTMLKATLFEDRHLHSRYRLDAARYNFALKSIQSINAVVGQLDEGNSLGDFTQRRACERAEAFKTVVSHRSVAAV